MQSSVNIRMPTLADASAIATLVTELGYPSTRAEIAERLARLISMESAYVRVADINGEVIGLVIGHIFPSIHVTEVVAWLTTLVVSSKARREGIGRLLASSCEEWAKGQGALRLSLTSGIHRDDAHVFYTRLGYDSTGIRFTKHL
jgi:GNAT superfamily N-acetyltransferase